MQTQIVHHFLHECDFDRPWASNKSGVVSNQALKPLAMENMQTLQSTIANTKFKGCRT